MGTTIYGQLPQGYRKRFYGQKTYGKWQFDNGEKLLNPLLYFKNDTPKSIDHIPLPDCLKLGILTETDFETRKFIGLVREPVSRFLSICNFKNLRPGTLIGLIKNKNAQNLYNESMNVNNATQVESFVSPLPIDLTLIVIEEKELIKEWFAKFNITLDLDIHRNVSNKIFTEKDLTKEHLDFIHNHFKSDFDLYNHLKNSGGTLNFKNHTHVSIP